MDCPTLNDSPLPKYTQRPNNKMYNTFVLTTYEWLVVLRQKGLEKIASTSPITFRCI